jgi:hypothetical protein
MIFGFTNHHLTLNGLTLDSALPLCTYLTLNLSTLSALALSTLNLNLILLFANK